MRVQLHVAPSEDLIKKLHELSDAKFYQRIKVASLKDMSGWMFETLRFKTRIEAFKRSSGKLQRRWQMDVTPNAGIITNDSKHLGFINNGTGIYGPRKEKIVMRWLIGKLVPIAVNPATIKKGESYIVGDNGEALIFRRCTEEAIRKGGWTHNGIKPMQFIEKTFDDFERDKLEDVLKNYVIGLFS